MPDISFYDTWLKKPIENTTHHEIANGYANSWLVDPAAIINDEHSGKRNPDGSYEFELIIEFGPRRIFYVGLVFSITTVLASLLYLVYGLIGKRRQYVSTSLKSSLNRVDD